MNQQQPELPEPDPQAASLESLEKRLRALPPPTVPGDLASRMIAAIPPVSAAGTAAGAWKLWLWLAGVGGVGVVAAALTYAWMANRNPNPAAPAKVEGGAGNSTNVQSSPTSKAIRDYEEAIRVDPYNADAWFALAKAQAAANRSDEAVSSAQKALDVARSRDRTDLVQTIEAWLQSRRKGGGR